MAEEKHGVELAENFLRLEEAAVSVTRLEPVPVEKVGTEEAFSEEIKKFMPKPGTVIVWSYAGIQWGTWDGVHIALSRGTANPKDVLELRVFNRDEELHLLREDGSFVGRLIADGTGESCYHVDSFSRLWGERDMQADIPEGYVRLADHDRKLEMDVPFDGTTENLKYLGLETRNYVTSDASTGLSGYGDYRYLAIEPAWGGRMP